MGVLILALPVFVFGLLTTGMVMEHHWRAATVYFNGLAVFVYFEFKWICISIDRYKET